MNWGLMWYQGDGSLEDKVRNAALRYEEKHGQPPNTCFVLSNKPVVVEGLDVIVDGILPDENHVWVGVRGGEE